jgi:hypothetical protein
VGRGTLVCLAVAAIVAGGCGDDEHAAPAVSLKAHQAEVTRDPYALTCADIARQPLNSTNQRLVIHAEFALAEDPALRERVEAMTSNRVGRSVYWALTELCKGREESYAPGKAAVQAVRDGKYLVQPRPQSWSRPELWSDPAVKEVGGE